MTHNGLEETLGYCVAVAHSVCLFVIPLNYLMRSTFGPNSKNVKLLDSMTASHTIDDYLSLWEVEERAGGRYNMSSEHGNVTRAAGPCFVPGDLAGGSI